KFPLELKMSSKGSVVIDKIVYGENDTKIYYKNKGTVLYRPSITLLDNGGRNMLENVPILFQNNVVDRDSGLYVNILPKLDGNKVSKLQYVTDEKFELLYDYKISIPLK
ncbi:MAG: hypothetical protein Q8920_16820, partial [Bacillota bacterium]|nr:hypothetical protein [Bacillota bacterium]